MSTLEVLRKGRQRIELGWAQGAMRSTTNYCMPFRYCALGAVWDAPQNTVALHCLQAALRGAHVAAWNDAPGRTKADVMFAYDRAIRIAEALEAA